MPQCALSLGTNLGDGSKNLENALSSVSRLPKTELLRTSCVYKTPAWGVTDQPDFLNCCALIETMLLRPRFWAAASESRRQWAEKGCANGENGL